MKKKFLLFTLLTGAVSAYLLFTPSGCTPGTVNATVSNGLPNSYASLPLDITLEKQSAADSFSWRSFIAMNWPADSATCGPDTSNGHTILSGKGPVVWETYLSTDQVFVTPPATPDGWCSTVSNKKSINALPPKVLALARQTGVYRFLHRISKSPMGLEQAVGGPLVDQNGRFARYEVRMNKDEYNYITTNNLWNAAGQQQYLKGNTTAMPSGPSAYGPAGAMECKAAWKVLGKGDDPSKFYTIKAIVYNDDSGDPSPGENPVTLGLAGLHIAHKTATQGNWVWSTFEQVDNLTRSFFNPACDTCKPNQSIPGTNYYELNPDGSPHNKPTQVTRVNAVDDPFADSINLYFQSLLKGSVWANYKLVSTQWLLFENMTPLYLANSVQETFVQGPHPASYGGYPLKIDQPYYTSPLYKPFSLQVSASCMGCHYVATVKDSTSTIRSDFSFIMSEAH